MGRRNPDDGSKYDEPTPAGDGSDGATETETESDQDAADEAGESENSQTRRTVLKGTAAAAAAVGAGAVGATGTADAFDVSDAGDYEVWTVSGKEIYDLSEGETLSNVLIDQSADGACLTIRSRNRSGWTVRNVGFVGVGQAGNGGNRFQFQVSAPGGGRGTIENIWASGKARDGQPATELGGIYIRSSHAGHIDIRHTYIEGFGNNAVYASAVGKDGGNDGSVTLENCYHRDNTVSQFRIGSPDSVVRNSVGIVNDPDGDRGWYPGTNGNRNARGIWGKHYPGQRIENSAFYVSPNDAQPDGVFEARYISNRSHGREAVVESASCDVNADAPTMTGSTSNARVNLTDLGERPTVTVIQDGGVPLTPEMAAAGDRSMPPELPGAEAGPRVSTEEAVDVGGTEATLRGSVESLGGAETADVGFACRPVGASDWDRTAMEARSGPGEFERTLSGLTAGNEYEFRAIAEVSDGESATARTVTFATDAAAGLDRTLTVAGSGAGWTDYEFTVSGEVAEHADAGTIGVGDSIEGSTASGFVNGGSDGYFFSGEVTDITVDGGADVVVDGTVVDPADLGDVDPVVATDAATSVGETEATLNGSLESLGGADAAEVTFEYRQTGASDWTRTATENRSSTGSFNRTISALSAETDYEFRAIAEVSDGESATARTVTFATDAAAGLDRTLTVDGSGAGWTNYEFTVSGEVAENAEAGTLGVGDSIEGSTASGFVNGGSDGYVFSGEVTDITVDGDAAILVDGQEIDPDGLVLPNEIAFAANGSGSETSYTVEVSGDLETDPEGPIEADDEIDGGTVTGTVSGEDRDAFRFSGDVVSLFVDGDATVSFEDNDG